MTFSDTCGSAGALLLERAHGRERVVEESNRRRIPRPAQLMRHFHLFESVTNRPGSSDATASRGSTTWAGLLVESRAVPRPSRSRESRRAPERVTAERRIANSRNSSCVTMHGTHGSVTPRRRSWRRCGCGCGCTPTAMRWR